MKPFLALKVAVVLLATCALAEVATRSLLFSRLCSDWPLARQLRVQWRFGSAYSDELHYAIRFRWLPEEARAFCPEWAPYADPRVGWTSYLFAPPDYANLDEAGIGERRVVLLFGDSFAGCSGMRDRV